MPIPISLDDKSYKEIMENALSRIAELCPDWTDRNKHDPGIMMLELMSWLTEQQRFYLEQVASPELLYPLVGYSFNRVCPATCEAQFVSKADIQLTIPAGTQVFAEEVCFETDTSVTVRGGSIRGYRRRGSFFDAARQSVFFPFGLSPSVGDSFEIVFARPITPNESIRISVLVDEPKIQRNGFSDEAPADLARLKWEYLSENGLREAQSIDNTLGFLLNGEIILKTDSEMLQNEDGYYSLFCSLAWHEYDAVPTIQSLKTDTVKLIQQETMCESITGFRQDDGTIRISTRLSHEGINHLFTASDSGWSLLDGWSKRSSTHLGDTIFDLGDGIANEILVVSCTKNYEHYQNQFSLLGFPNQSFKLELHDKSVVYDSVSLLIKNNKGKFIQWHKAESLHSCEADDLCFTLDEVSGEVRFGDGFHGAIPKGQVLVAALALTHGERGNIKKNSLSDIKVGEHTIYVHQERHATGGLNHIHKHARKRAELPKRAVTADDYIQIAKNTPGLIIDKVNAFPSEHQRDRCICITVAVRPGGISGVLSDSYQKSIAGHLERHRLAGVDIEVVSPEYVNIHLDCTVSAGVGSTDIRKEIEDSLRTVFDERFGDFGAVIQKNELFAHLDTLPQVIKTKFLSLRSDSPDVRFDDAGNIWLEKQCIARLVEVNIFY